MTLRVWYPETALTDWGRGARERHGARSRSGRQTAPSDDGGELPPGNTRVRDSRKTPKCEWGRPSDSPAAVHLAEIIISPDYRLLGYSCPRSAVISAITASASNIPRVTSWRMIPGLLKPTSALSASSLIRFDVGLITSERHAFHHGLSGVVMAKPNGRFYRHQVPLGDLCTQSS
jgi:hypothetical protein